MEIPGFGAEASIRDNARTSYLEYSSISDETIAYDEHKPSVTIAQRRNLGRCANRYARCIANCITTFMYCAPGHPCQVRYYRCMDGCQAGLRTCIRGSG
jgi:hypothetical protein